MSDSSGSRLALVIGSILVLGVVAVVVVAVVGGLVLPGGAPTDAAAGEQSGATPSAGAGETTVPSDQSTATTSTVKQTPAPERGGTTREGPSGGRTTADGGATTADGNEGRTTTRSEPEPLTYSVSHAGVVDRNYTALVRDAFQFWESTDDGIDTELVADPNRSDVHLRFTGRIKRCEGEVAETRFYYCTPDTTAGQSRVRISAIYEERFTRNLLRYVAGAYAGYDDPASHEGVRNLSAMGARYPDPWPLQSSIVVNLSVEVESDRDWASLVRAGVDYWNRNDDRYGTYTENLTFDPDAEGADVTVRIREEIPVCGIHDSPNGGTYLGCADVRNRTILANGSETISIVAGYTDETTVRTVKHEFGHLFGVGHGEQPMPIMNATDPDARLLPRPNTTERARPFGNGSVDVYVDYESFPASRARLRAEVRHAVRYYDGGADGHVPRVLDVRLTRDRSAAEIIVREGPTTACRGDGGDGSCGVRYGNDTDDDPALEVYARQNISIRGIDTAAIGWHVGFWMGFSVGGAESASELPDPFREADYDDRRAWGE